MRKDPVSCDFVLEKEKPRIKCAVIVVIELRSMFAMLYL